MLLKLLITVVLLWSETECDTTDSALYIANSSTIFHDDISDKLSPESTTLVTTVERNHTEDESKDQIKTTKGNENVELPESSPESTTPTVTTVNLKSESHTVDNNNVNFVGIAKGTDHVELPASNTGLVVNKTNSNGTDELSNENKPISNGTELRNVEIATSKHLPEVFEPPTTTTTTSRTTPQCLNCTTPKPQKEPTEEPPPLKSFNLNYLYFLLLLIPLIAAFVGIFCYCKRKNRNGYTEPVTKTTRTRRFSTPSWVFSEPDFADEEVITLEEEKK